MEKQNIAIKSISIIIIALLATACMDDNVIDLDNINTDIDMEYALSIPISHGGVSFSDIVTKVDSSISDTDLSEYISYDKNENIVANYTFPNSTITSSYQPYWGMKSVELPAIDINTFQLLPEQSISAKAFFKTNVKRAFFKSVAFEIKMVNNQGEEKWPNGFTMDIEFPVSVDGLPQKATNIASNQTITIENCWLYIDNNAITLNTISSTPNANGYLCYIRVPEINPFYIEGDVEESVEDMSYSEETELFSRNSDITNYQFGTKGPMVHTKFHNPIGADIKAYGTIDFYDNTTGEISDSILTDTIIIPSASLISDANGNPLNAERGVYENDYSVFDFTDKTIVNEIPFNAIRIRYTLLPLKHETNDLFIFTEDDYKKIDVESNLELPINIKVSESNFHEILDFNISNLIADDDEEYIRAVDQFDININLDNKLPIDFDVQFYLIDDKNEIVDSLFQNHLVVNSPNITSSKEEASTSKTKISFTGEKFDIWKDVKIMIFKAQANIGDYQEDTYVKFNKNDSITYNMAVEIKGHIIESANN